MTLTEVVNERVAPVRDALKSTPDKNLEGRVLEVTTVISSVKSFTTQIQGGTPLLALSIEPRTPYYKLASFFSPTENDSNVLPFSGLPHP